MPKVVITHGVSDVDTWLSGKAERAASIGSMGGSDVSDFVAEDGSNAVAITAEVADVASMKESVTSPSPELMEVMGRHGVMPPVFIYVAR